MSQVEVMSGARIFGGTNDLEAEGPGKAWSLRKILSRIFPDARKGRMVDARAPLEELVLDDLEGMLRAAGE